MKMTRLVRTLDKPVWQEWAYFSFFWSFIGMAERSWKAKHNLTQGTLRKREPRVHGSQQSSWKFWPALENQNMDLPTAALSFWSRDPKPMKTVNILVNVNRNVNRMPWCNKNLSERLIRSALRLGIERLCSRFQTNEHYFGCNSSERMCRRMQITVVRHRDILSKIDSI